MTVRKSLVAVVLLAGAFFTTAAYAQTPSIQSIDTGVNYDEARDRYVFTASVAVDEAVSPNWVLVDFLGATRPALLEVSGVLDHLENSGYTIRSDSPSGHVPAILRVNNVWAVQDPDEPTRYTATY